METKPILLRKSSMKNWKYDDVPPLDIVDTENYGTKKGEYDSWTIETLMGPQETNLEEIDKLLSN